jgi:putative nucleotidyltransferase with HDIG domain
MFLLASLIIVALFPNKRQFKYEFQKNEFWKYEDLVAPFDFPIYKTEDALKLQRDSALNGFMPYFSLNDTMVTYQVNRLSSDFNSKWESVSKTIPANKYTPEYMNTALKDTIFKNLSNALIAAYNVGIMNPLDFKDALLNYPAVTSIMIVKNNVAEAKPIKDIPTEKIAYENIKKTLNQYDIRYDNGNAGIYNELFNQLNISTYIVSNITFSQSFTNNIRENLLSNISLTEGLVNKNASIISRGDYIDQAKFQLLVSLKKEYEVRSGGAVWLGKLIVILLFNFILFTFIYTLRRDTFNDFTRTSFILLMVIIFVFSSSLLIRINSENLFLFPFVILPIIIRAFYDDRLAVFLLVHTIFLIGIFVPNKFEFIALNFIAGMVAVFSMKTAAQRSRVIVTAINVGITYCILYSGMALMQDQDVQLIDYSKYAAFGINSLLILTSFPLIYIFEKTFGFLSDASLVELSDTNRPILRKLAEKAPGTFQHSLQVSNLAEEAVNKIGGNSLLVRAGALYHDIGKMDIPLYFIENQDMVVNMHDKLDFNESARIIISHVDKGVDIARRYKVPKPVVDFIRTHHGTSTVQYFYKSFKNKFPEKSVDIRKFSYPGPKPFSKETAIVMMADSIEAASRTLEQTTDKSIDDLVENIINFQIIEEQFSDADITFRDISIIKDTFKKRLRNIYHARIAYPA